MEEYRAMVIEIAVLKLECVYFIWENQGKLVCYMFSSSYRFQSCGATAKTVFLGWRKTGE